MKPALTPEEWKQAFDADLSGRRNPRESDAVFEGTTPETCHYIAALALHGQSFGFSEHDVKFLREFAANWFPNNLSEYQADTVPARNALLDLAARIEALLPPEVEFT